MSFQRFICCLLACFLCILEKFIVRAACCHGEIRARFFAGKNDDINEDYLFEIFFSKAIIPDVI